MKLGRLAVRSVVGALFVGHGTQKLFGWFGGGGLDGTGQAFESLGLKPGRRHALAAGIAETGGGSLLALGLLTPLAASALIGTMATAIRQVHFKNGPWATEGGYEYNIVLVATLLALVDGGPGELSFDRVLRLHDTGVGWALAALGGGLAGSTFAVESGKRYDQPVDQSAPSNVDQTA
jgi:putative oxidoreductase